MNDAQRAEYAALVDRTVRIAEFALLGSVQERVPPLLVRLIELRGGLTKDGRGLNLDIARAVLTDIFPLALRRGVAQIAGALGLPEDDPSMERQIERAERECLDMIARLSL
jgi:hypothetical protein